VLRPPAALQILNRFSSYVLEQYKSTNTDTPAAYSIAHSGDVLEQLYIQLYIQHTSAYVSLRQHTEYSAFGGRARAAVHTAIHTAYVSIRQLTSAYGIQRIRGTC
jgi:hypothetical protein